MATSALPGGFIQSEEFAGYDGAGMGQLSSRQESKLIHYVDQKLLEISRLYKRRAVEESDQAVAAEALDQLLAEISTLLELFTQVPLGSAKLVTAYALNILDIITDYIKVFNRSPDPTFRLLHELDELFLKLMRHDVLSVTERTRLSALTGRLRNIVYTKYEGLEKYETQCSQVLEGSIALI